MPTAYKISVTPPAENCSASFNVETVAGPECVDIIIRATSMHLDVFRCGRNETLKGDRWSFSLLMLALTFLISRIRDGVSMVLSVRFSVIAQPPLWYFHNSPPLLFPAGSHNAVPAQAQNSTGTLMRSQHCFTDFVEYRPVFHACYVCSQLNQ